MGEEADLVKARFARGCRCFGVFLDGAIAGYGWLSTDPEWIGEVQVEIRPRKVEAYIWNCVTLPEHRRKGIFRSLVVGIAQAAAGSGARRVWIGSVAIPAEYALPASGFQPAARFRILAVAGLHLMTVSFERSELGREARRVLAVNRGVYLSTRTRRRH